MTTYRCLRCHRDLGTYEHIYDVPECPYCADIPDEDLPEPGYVCIECGRTLYNRWDICRFCFPEED